MAFCSSAKSAFGKYRQNETRSPHLNTGKIRGLCSRGVPCENPAMLILKPASKSRPILCPVAATTATGQRIGRDFEAGFRMSIAGFSHGTPREQSPRIFPVFRWGLRVSFCRYLPNALLALEQKAIFY